MDDLAARALLILGWAVASYLTYRALIPFFTSAAEATASDRDAASRVPSTVHALVVLVLGGATVLTTHPADVTDASPPYLGTISLCVSVGYFIQDIFVMLHSKYEPLLPLLLHHSGCALCMGLIALAVPRAVWYACLLQCTEATVPLQTLIFFLERAHGYAVSGGGTPRDAAAAGAGGGSADWALYALSRWSLLVTWLLVREALFVYFAFVVARDWEGLTPVMKVLGWGTGVPLALFNTGGLIHVVLVGFPWWPPPAKEERAKTS